MSVIILEGIDKCGKSTLARELSKKYKAELIKISAPKTKKPYDEYINIVNSLKQNKNYVIDRFHLGEFAYGPIYRNACGLSVEQQFYLENLLLKHNPFLIYCWLDYNQLAWNFCHDKEESTRFEDVPRLSKTFQEVFHRSILPKTTFNYKLNKTPKINTFKTPVLNLSYVGNFNPEFLFVGDEPNYNFHLKKNIPYSVLNSSSGMFLMKSLKILMLNFGLVNSTEGNILLSKSDLNKIRPKHIICLGENAYRRVLKIASNAYNVIKVSHPQYAKRFYGKNALLKYTLAILEEVNHARN